MTLYDFVNHSKEDIDEKIERIVSEKGHYLGERLYRHKSGKIIDVDVNVSLISYGARDVMCVVSRDITERKLAERERERLISELQNALAQIKKISGMLPICSCCKKIRDDKGYWHQLEEYIDKHSEAEFTHSICPECAKKLYPEYRFDK